MNISTMAIKKAKKSICKHKISAIGLNKKGEVIGTAFNTPRFSKQGGGNHAEMTLMKNHGPSIKTIIICRVNKNGKLIPIHPCKACQKTADELGIKIISIQDYE